MDKTVAVLLKLFQKQNYLRAIEGPRIGGLEMRAADGTELPTKAVVVGRKCHFSTPACLREALKEAVERTGISGLTVHEFRSELDLFQRFVEESRDDDSVGFAVVRDRVTLRGRTGLNGFQHKSEPGKVREVRGQVSFAALQGVRLDRSRFALPQGLAGAKSCLGLRDVMRSCGYAGSKTVCELEWSICAYDARDYGCHDDELPPAARGYFDESTGIQRSLFLTVFRTPGFGFDLDRLSADVCYTGADQGKVLALRAVQTSWEWYALANPSNLPALNRALGDRSEPLTLPIQSTTN